MDIGLALSLQQQSTIPARFMESAKASRPLINPQALLSSQTFRSKLEDLEQTIENQKQGIRTFVRPEPIIGMKPGTAIGAIGGGGGFNESHTSREAEEAEDDADDDAATLPGVESSNSHSHSHSHSSDSQDLMMLGGELHDSGDGSEGEGEGEGEGSEGEFVLDAYEEDEEGGGAD